MTLCRYAWLDVKHYMTTMNNDSMRLFHGDPLLTQAMAGLEAGRDVGLRCWNGDNCLKTVVECAMSKKTVETTLFIVPSSDRDVLF